jgi:diguanylate cyclase (GGDEF)-like protein/PAS domain S-box-containing protein
MADMQSLSSAINADGLLPHGYCLTWSPGLLSLHVISDLLIVLAYYSIPVSLIYFTWKRKDLPYPGLFLMFSLFIVACGTTHLLSAITIWFPLYWLDGIVKAITAVISLIAVAMMFKVIPRALALRSPAQLETEIQERKQAETLLFKQKEFSEEVITSLPGIFYMLDTQGKFVRVNQQFFEVSGYSQDEFDRMSALDFFAGDDKNLIAGKIKETFEKGDVTAEAEFLTKSGKKIPYFFTGHLTSIDKQAYLIGLGTDITESKAATDKINFLAFYDPLTGLANRRLLSDRMEQMLSLSRRTGELVAICMIDLDGFKQVNDQKGHKAGDQLLKEVAMRLQECIRHSDTASRLGGDEFVLVLGGFNEISECVQSINRIISLLAAPYSLVNDFEKDIAHVTASVGVTIFPNDNSNADQLLRHADESMYEAKHEGKNCYRLFNPSYQNQHDAKQATLKKIEKALAEAQLTLYYQPQVNCRLGKVTGVEALIRWKHPILGLLPPSDFIPIVEHHDLIITIGEWVIRQALEQLLEWRTKAIDLRIAVNISARQLHQHDFIDRLTILLADYDAEIINRLEIEILETAVLDNLNVIATAIQKCREMGLGVAIDDFGTGFSSLAHLRKIPFDVIKIDKSFVSGMLKNPEDLVLVNSVIGLATSFKRKVIAEGVESIDHVLMLLELGCDQMQGYEIARPMPADQIPNWLKKFVPNPFWQLGSTERPSRDYFEMLLAEVNHRHWINDLVDKLSDPQEAFNPELLLDHRQCSFGHWYYGDGSRQFGNESWFLPLESLHQRIHQTAVQLCEHKRAGDLTAIEADEECLLSQQNEFDTLLRSLRASLATNYSISQSTKLQGRSL